MLNTRIKKAIFGAAVAVTAVVGSIGQAQAAVYRGAWDPTFGGIFPNLGWQATATLVLPNSCLGMTGSFLNSAAGCGGGGMQVNDATVEFYDITDPLHTVLQTLHFGSAPVVYSMQIAATIPGDTSLGNTQLLGVDTGFFNPVKGTIPLAQYGGNDYYFYLALKGNLAGMVYTDIPQTSPVCSAGIFGTSPTECGVSTPSEAGIFTPQVPEPETYALMLAGLGAVGFMVRRRRQ